MCICCCLPEDGGRCGNEVDLTISGDATELISRGRKPEETLLLVLYPWLRLKQGCCRECYVAASRTQVSESSIVCYLNPVLHVDVD